jgi:hypothetical protein
MRPLRGANIGCADVLGFAFGMTLMAGALQQDERLLACLGLLSLRLVACTQRRA